LRLAALLHTEGTDDSSGTAGFDGPVATRLVDDQDRLVVARESAAEQQAVAEDQTVEGMDTTADQEPATGEQLLPQEPVSDDEPTGQMQPVVDLDPSLVEEQATAEIDAAQAEAETDHETEAVTNERISYEEPQTDGEPTVGGQAADIDFASTEVASTVDKEPDKEQKPAEQKAAEQLLIEYPLRNVGASPEDDFDWSWAWFEDYDLKEDADSGVTDGQPELVTEPDEVDHPASVELATTGWALYIDVYPDPADGFETDLVVDGMSEGKKREETVQPASNGHGSNGHEDHELKDSGSQGQARANQISGRV
jgi:hypothetical protein